MASTTGLDFKKGTLANYNGIKTKNNNTLYFAIDGSYAHLYLGAINIIPKLLDVAHGGTGNTAFNSGGVLYYNGSTKTVKDTASGGEGTLLAGNKGTPVFAQPTVGWTDGTDKGPTYYWAINNKTLNATIPSASSSISGAVTTVAQNFAGLKTFDAGAIQLTSSAKIQYDDTKKCFNFVFN